MTRRALGPRVIIAGTSSGVGKTTIATTIMAELYSRGFRVAPAKIGPDFIDPGYHELACSRRSRNLDSFLLGSDAIPEALLRISDESDITVIEGVMGLFDGTLMSRPGSAGIDPKITFGSTAEIASLTRTPVILILDATATSTSLAATLEGFCNFSQEIDVRGVIINNYGSPSHLDLIRHALRNTTLDIIAEIPRGAVPSWRSRHLGLLPPIENPTAVRDSISALREHAAPLIDIAGVITIATSAPPVVVDIPEQQPHPAPITTVAVATGKAFSFVYPENLEALERAGAKVVFFDPLVDEELPREAKGLYLGGGFPEVYAAELSRNRTLNSASRRAIRDGLPTWAECGGLMWLAREVDGQKMVGALPVDIRMTKRLTLGYAIAQAKSDSCLSDHDTIIYGHEFHYSVASPTGTGLSLRTRNGTKEEGFVSSSIFASYLHVHLGSQQALADRFISKCT